VERESVVFWLKVKPRSSLERLGFDAEGELRLQLQAPATQGQANEDCLRFFAKLLRLPPACVAILAGRKSRRKLVRITGRSAEDTLGRLKRLAAVGGRAS
jgi:uncharacterized protein (TIGR00251 family)